MGFNHTKLTNPTWYGCNTNICKICNSSFKQKIYSNYSNGKFSIIAEIKKASPSAGVIIQNYNPVNIAEVYEKNKATCLSVLTEEDFFHGNLDHISKIKEKINLPILCKDFFIDKFQVPLAKSFGADERKSLIRKNFENLYKKHKKEHIDKLVLQMSKNIFLNVIRYNIKKNL